MPKVVFQYADGSQSHLEGDAGQSIMALALQNGVDGIIGECGGSCACATCHVYVAGEFLAELPEMDELEGDMLEGTACERTGASRLSCQITLSAALDGIQVVIPESQL